MDETKQAASGPSNTKRKPDVEKTVRVQNRKNRSTELYVGRSMWAFAPNEEKDLPEWVIDHPDFKQMSYLYTVKG